MGGIGSGGLREGAGRKPMDGTPRTKVSVTLPSALLSAVWKEADRRRISTSQMVTELIEKGFER